jgi:hypothetical protein
MHKIMPQIVNRAVENDVNPPGLQDFLLNAKVEV